MLKIYSYKGCGSCRAAFKWLNEHGIDYSEVPIREQPPTLDELRQMLDARGGDLRALFNTSGQDYRQMGLKDRLPGTSEMEALGWLAIQGNLVKRPFVIDQERGIFLCGFKEQEWRAALAK